MHNPHGDDQFKPNTTVAAVIVSNNKFLLVEEIDNGKTVFNQPAGHIEANENITNGTIREVLEETGLKVIPEYLSGIYYFHRPDLALYYLRFCFVVHLPVCVDAKPQDDEITACHWFTLEEIKDKADQMRSPMVIECIEDYLAGKKMPLDFISTNL